MSATLTGTPPAGSVLTLLAPVSGVVVPLDQVPDPVFAQRLAGDGVAIDPLGCEVVAPCDARVLQVHRAGHAVTLAADGLEIVIHVGLDTVDLRGAGFHPLVQAGDTVRAGDPILLFDADQVAMRARSLLTEVVVSSVDRVAALRPSSGRVLAGRDVLLEVGLLRAGAEDATAEGDEVASQPVVVAAATGLHARPAAQLAALVRRFDAQVRLLKAGREADARSLVSIMALEVGGGDAVTVVARGPDAAGAVAAVAEHLATHPDTPAEAGPAPAAAAPAAPGAGPVEEGVYRGVPAAPGLAVGRVFRPAADQVVVEERGGDPVQEQRILDGALEVAAAQLERLRRHLLEDAAADRAEIFAAHRELLEDPVLADSAAAAIRAGASAPYAWKQAYTAQADRIQALESPLLRERAADLRDVGRRVLRLITGGGATMEVPPESIVLAEELTPSEVASLDRARVRGLCTTGGSTTSHVAILARGLGIPAVAAVDPRALELEPGTRVVLDGDQGVLDAAPGAEAEARVAARQETEALQRAAELAAAGEAALTRDGHRVGVVANLGEEAEAHRVAELGGEGVGLLRSEFLFMDRQAPPGEDEQARVYQAVARALGPERLLVIRTLDVGGDKPLPYLPVAAEANPFLGERGIRLSLARPDLLRTQIRAILRASVAGRVAVMFPMIATLAEWRAARALVEAERAALGVPPIEVGIMVETAAAALLSDRFAEEADFFSIGTNDLAQYTLAMDRGNPRLAARLDALHPAVLRLIERTVAAARAGGRWVGVCGALAGDPQAVPVLVGLGVDELSVDVPLVPAVKARIRTLSLDACRATAEQALAAADGAQVRALVARRHD